MVAQGQPGLIRLLRSPGANTRAETPSIGASPSLQGTRHEATGWTGSYLVVAVAAMHHDLGPNHSAPDHRGTLAPCRRS